MPGFVLKQKVRDGEQETARDIAVEDGKWVVPHAGTGHSSDQEWDEDGGLLYKDTTTLDCVIVGPKPVRHVLDRVGGSRTYHCGRSSHSSCSNAFVGDQPFGVILMRKENDKECFGLHFVCSRQVHKGELGQTLPIARPRFAREARADAPAGAPSKPRDQRRSHIRWARLTEAAALIGMGAEEMLRRYIRFTHAERPSIDVRFAERREEIHMQAPSVPARFLPTQLDALLARGLETAWVRKGFACTALCLHALGHAPEPWFAPAAPQPEPDGSAVAAL